MGQLDLLRRVTELEAENERLRERHEETLTALQDKNAIAAEARVAALEEALRGAMKKLQRYGEQTEDESAALAPTKEATS